MPGAYRALLVRVGVRAAIDLHLLATKLGVRVRLEQIATPARLVTRAVDLPVAAKPLNELVRLGLAQWRRPQWQPTHSLDVHILREAETAGVDANVASVCLHLLGERVLQRPSTRGPPKRLPAVEHAFALEPHAAGARHTLLALVEEMLEISTVGVVRGGDEDQDRQDDEADPQRHVCMAGVFSTAVEGGWEGGFAVTQRTLRYIGLGAVQFNYDWRGGRHQADYHEEG